MIEFLLAMGTTAVLTALLRQAAVRVGWVHCPNPNKRMPKANPHPRVIAMGGGLAIFAGILVGASAGAHSYAHPLVFGLASGALLLGLWDDLKDCRATMKLTVQTLLGIATVLWLGQLHGLPSWLGLPITVFGVVGLMNAVNILDNMDGIVGGLMTLAMLGYAWLGMVTQNSTVTVLSLAVAGACFGFWLHNKPPASIFMGDVGSMMLGYLLAVVGTLATHGQYPNEIARLVAPLLPAGVFITNTVFVTVWRKTHKLPITFWCLEHNLNYRAIALFGPSLWKINVAFYAVQAGLVILARVSAVTPLLVTSALFLLSVGGLFGLSWRLWQVEPEDVHL